MTATLLRRVARSFVEAGFAEVAVVLAPGATDVAVRGLSGFGPGILRDVDVPADLATATG